MPKPVQKRKAIFLDRDGVINRTIFRDGKPRAPDHPDEFEFFPGVTEAVQALKNAGFLLIVVTNQPDVARGWQTRERVEEMNRKVESVLKVDEIRVCYHVDEDGCVCRKPKPGMLLECSETWEIDLLASFMVGDRDGDIQAGRAAGCTTVLVTNNEAGAPAKDGDDWENSAPHARVASLLEAAKWILSRPRSS